MSDPRTPVERQQGGDHDEFIGEEIMTREARGGFEGEHGERGAGPGDAETPEQADDPGPV